MDIELARVTNQPCGILTFLIMNKRHLRDDTHLYQVKCTTSNRVAGITTDFEVFRDNPDGMWMPAAPHTHNTSWTHQSSFAGLGTWTLATEALCGTTTMATYHDERMIQLHAVFNPETDMRQADINNLINAEEYMLSNTD
eukprot:5723742-Heterocapsa_arctica.AAC.2